MLSTAADSPVTSTPTKSETSAATAAAESDAAAAPGSVIALFCRELLEAPPVLQRLHLRELALRIRAFVDIADDKSIGVTGKEWEGLLLCLHGFLHGKEGLTPLQSRINTELRDRAFALIRFLVVDDHPCRPAVRAAYVELMERVEWVAERIADPGRFDDLPVLNAGLAIDHDEITREQVAAVEARVAEVQEREKAQWDQPSATAETDPVAGLAAHPHWYTIDCLPPEVAGTLTEAEFQAVELWFAELEQPTPGKYAVSAGVAAADRLMGCRVLSKSAMAEWTKLFPDGTGALADVVRFMFPDTPAWVVQQRIEGACLADPSGEVPTTPAALYRPPLGEQLAHELAMACVHEAALADKVLLLCRIFEAADVQAMGRVSLPALLHVTGSRATAGTVDFAQAVQRGLGRPTSERHAEVTFAQLARGAFSDADAEALAKAVDKAVKACTRDRAARLSAAASATQPEFKKAPKRLTVNHRMHLRQRAATLAAEVRELHTVAQRSAVDQQALRREIQALLDVQATRHAADAAEDAKNVPCVQGPRLPPKRSKHAVGIEYGRELFDFSALLEIEMYRGDVIRMLRAFDALGIHPDLFLQADRRAAHVLDVVLCERRVIYRDVACSARRPPGRGFWAGNHALQVKTNIVATGDVKYSLTLEGYNPGTAAPIFVVTVGFASRTVPAVGSLERFGWPDGWDSLATVRFVDGVHVEQYVSTDGVVCVELRAKSLSQVGLSISCAQLCPEFTSSVPFAATVYHSANRL